MKQKKLEEEAKGQSAGDRAAIRSGYWSSRASHETGQFRQLFRRRLQRYGDYNDSDPRSLR